MFMSNVVHDRVEIAKPWRDYQSEGNSLFVWRLLFGVFTLVVFGGLFAFFFIQGGALYDAGLARSIPWSFILGFGLVTLAVVLVWGYIALFLKEFVAALMFKHRVSAGEAWRRFLGALQEVSPAVHRLRHHHLPARARPRRRRHLVRDSAPAASAAILLAIPYISTVVLLPVLYAYRAFGLEFLAQFGPDFDVFPKPTAAEPAPVAPVAPAV